MRDQVSQPYNTTSNVIVLYVLTFNFSKVVIVVVPMPTHCTITCFEFHARRIDDVECGLFSINAPLGQTTLRVERVSV